MTVLIHVLLLCQYSSTFYFYYYNYSSVFLLENDMVVHAPDTAEKAKNALGCQ